MKVFYTHHISKQGRFRYLLKSRVEIKLEEMGQGFNSVYKSRAKYSSLSQLPIIDIRPLRDPAASTKSKLNVGKELDEACRKYGFFYIKGHQVNEKHENDMTKEAHELTKWFFDLPLEIKNSISIKSLDEERKRKSKDDKNEGITSKIWYRGYQRVGENVTLSRRDIHEAIDYYKETVPSTILSSSDHENDKQNDNSIDAFYENFVGENPFLSSDSIKAILPSGREKVRENKIEEDRLEKKRQAFSKFFHPKGPYITEMLNLGNDVMSGLALGLNLPLDYFTPYYNESYWCLRLIRYPHVSRSEGVDINEDSLGVGEHSDYGCLTFVNMDENVEALQVKIRSDLLDQATRNSSTVSMYSNSSTLSSNLNSNEQEFTYIFADPVPDTFVVNIGDMLAHWTANQYVATRHRVLPFTKDPEKSRISIPFFFEPNIDAIISPLQTTHTCSSVRHYNKESIDNNKGENPKEILFGRHLYSKVSNNFNLYG